MKKIILLLTVLFIFSGAALAEDYRNTKGTSIIRASDSAIIPADSANNDYAKFMKWEAKGNVPAAYVAPVKTKAERIAADATMPTMLERIRALEGTQADKDAMKARIDAIRAKY